MIIGVPRESSHGERRVALVPEVVGRLLAAGHEVVVESGAGQHAGAPDAAFEEAGARIVSADEAWSADLVARVQPPSLDEVARLRSSAAIIGFLRPLDDLTLVGALADRGVTSFAMELVPRITRAQSLDALSAMSTVGGYRAVLLAASTLPKFFPLLTTAAGTVRPAKALVLGAGVAGLQAIATARRLGAEVSAYDVRAASAEEVRSLGAKFIELDLDTADAQTAGGYAKALDEDRQRRQVELLGQVVAKADAVITTALIPGRPAPVLITAEAVGMMDDGSVIVDMAAPNGGNCELTVPGETVVRGGVTIHGVLNLPADMPIHASQMYARTVRAAIEELTEGGELRWDPTDEIITGLTVTREGAIVHPRVQALAQPATATDS